MTPAVTVVSPLYRSSRQVGALIERLDDAMSASGEPWEIVLIDDHCPEMSGAAAIACAPRTGEVRVARLDRNVGQLAAVNLGIQAARGDVVVIADADLQDRPEDVPELVDRLRRGPAEVVCAGRRGRYTSGSRRLSARAFRLVRTWLSRGRIPGDAGLFLAVHRDTACRAIEQADPSAHLVSALARSAASFTSVPLVRDNRTVGTSGYTWRRRAAIAGRALLVLTPAYRGVRQRMRRSWRAPRVEWWGAPAEVER